MPPSRRPHLRLIAQTTPTPFAPHTPRPSPSYQRCQYRPTAALRNAATAAGGDLTRRTALLNKGCTRTVSCTCFLVSIPFISTAARPYQTNYNSQAVIIICTIVLSIHYCYLIITSQPCTINAASVHAKKLGRSTSVNVRGRSLLPSHFRRSRSLLVGGVEWKGVGRRLFIYCKLRTPFKKPKGPRWRVRVERE